MRSLLELCMINFRLDRHYISARREMHELVYYLYRI